MDNQTASQEPLQQQCKIYHSTDGHTDQSAVRQLMDELRTLIQQKQENFKESKEQNRQKIIVAFQRLCHPFTLLTFAYLTTQAHNVQFLYR